MEINVLKKLIIFIIFTFILKLSFSSYFISFCIFPQNISICSIYEFEEEREEGFQKFGKIKVEFSNFSLKKEIYLDFNESDFYEKIFTKEGYKTIERVIVKNVWINMKNLKEIKIYLNENLVNEYSFEKVEEKYEELESKNFNYFLLIILVFVLILIVLVIKIKKFK
jgi:hypothetical protein